jgi:hypothetical protein
MKYLQDKQHYIDNYDKLTVDGMRRFEEIQKKTYEESEHPKLAMMFNNVSTHFRAGDYYAQKEESINKWMQADKNRDDVYKNAAEPENITCNCGARMINTFKDLYQDTRVLFFFDCPNKCKPKKAYFTNGEEWKFDSGTCPKCEDKLDRKYSKVNDSITTTYTCVSCDYKDVDVINLGENKKKELTDPNFENDKKRFCISENEHIKNSQK